MTLFLLLGSAAVLFGCLCLYLASPHQRYLAHAWPVVPTRVAGTVLLTAGLAAFGQALQPLAAVFVFIAALMMMLTLLPYLGALISLFQEQ